MRTHGVGCRQRLTAPVLQEVQVNLLLPLGWVSLQTGDLRQFPMGEACNDLSELARLLVAAAPAQWDINMQPGFPGRLAIVCRAGGIENLTHSERRIHNRFKR